MNGHLGYFSRYSPGGGCGAALGRAERMSISACVHAVVVAHRTMNSWQIGARSVGVGGSVVQERHDRAVGENPAEIYERYLVPVLFLPWAEELLRRAALITA